jgi:MoaA/NifB/PqqE/SkfB family radical SAM enzyme
LVCPRSALEPAWREGNLDPRVWARLREDLGLAEYVHLQGWGEPLLDQQLPRRVREARDAGCHVGITTNGERLEEAAEWIVSERLDRLTVSVAGCADTHAALREGSPLDQVWNGVQAIAERRRGKRPRILVSYLLTRDNSEELTETVRSAAAAGADELFVTHVDHAPTRRISELAAFNQRGLLPGVAEALKDAADLARSQRVAFRAPATSPEELLVCALDPTRFVFVSWDGRVGPCVNLLLPVAGAIPRWNGETILRVEPVVYGDLSRSSLPEILDGEARRHFTSVFEERLAAEERFRSGIGGWGKNALERLERADARRSAELAHSPFPAACSGCPKISGW